MTIKYFEGDMRSWMADLPSDKKRNPLIYLAIPGSHNTFSYSISKDANVSPDAPYIVQRLSLFAKPLVNPCIYKWSCTQTYDIEEQLLKGIRYLDFRVVSCNGIDYVCHGLYGGALDQYLVKVLQFLTKYKTEVVILDFQHFYNYHQKDHNSLVLKLLNIFGPFLCPVSCINDLTVSNLIENGKQVIVVYRCKSVTNNSFLWPSCTFPTLWPNKLKVDDLKEFLDLSLKNRNNDVGLVSQCLLTVDTSYVLRHPCKELRTMAYNTNSKMTSWLNCQVSGPNGVNIVICDFIQDCSFIKNVIEINKKS